MRNPLSPSQIAVLKKEIETEAARARAAGSLSGLQGALERETNLLRRVRGDVTLNT